MDAFLPLIGVVIGAFIGGGMTFLLDRRREKRAARAGLRLVVGELRKIRLSWHNLTSQWEEARTAETADQLISGVQGRRWAIAKWEAQQEVLAASLSDEDWEALVDVYVLVGLVDESLQTTPEPELRSELLVVMTDSLRHLEQAIERFRRGVGLTPL